MVVGNAHRTLAQRTWTRPAPLPRISSIGQSLGPFSAQSQPLPPSFDELAKTTVATATQSVKAQTTKSRERRAPNEHGAFDDEKLCRSKQVSPGGHSQRYHAMTTSLVAALSAKAAETGHAPTPAAHHKTGFDEFEPFGQDETRSHHLLQSFMSGTPLPDLDGQGVMHAPRWCHHKPNHRHAILSSSMVATLSPPIPTLRRQLERK